MQSGIFYDNKINKQVKVHFNVLDPNTNFFATIPGKLKANYEHEILLEHYDGSEMQIMKNSIAYIE